MKNLLVAHLAMAWCAAACSSSAPLDGNDAGGDANALGDAQSSEDTGPQTNHYALVTLTDPCGADGGQVNGSQQSTSLVAYDLTTNHVDGTLTAPINNTLLASTSQGAPLLTGVIPSQPVSLVVDLLDATKPWNIDQRWQLPFGGVPYLAGATLASATQLYVAYNAEQKIYVFDPTQTTNTSPTATIDVPSLTPQDVNAPSSIVVALLYAASSHTLYAVLFNGQPYSDMPLDCDEAHAAVIAIDTTTNTIVSLGGSAAAGGIPLGGATPTSAILDESNQRILVAEQGCISNFVTHAFSQAGVEAVDLTMNTTSTLVDTSNAASAAATGLDVYTPPTFIYIDAHHAVLSAGATEIQNTISLLFYAWDPTSTTLGMALPNVPSVSYTLPQPGGPNMYDVEPAFDYDGQGNLVGLSGSSAYDLVSMSLATGTVTTLTKNIFLNTACASGFSVAVWPHP